MDTALMSYEQRLDNANPLYAEETMDGYKITQQEAAFIHYYIQSGNIIQSFLKAGFTFPRRKITKREREYGVVDITRTEPLDDLYEKHNLNHGEAEKRKEEVLTILNKEYNLLEDKEDIANTIVKEEMNMEQDVLSEDEAEKKFLLQVHRSARHLLNHPAMKKEIASRLEAIKSAQVADTHEVMAYFTAVMRGQVLDQFGLEASLQERTRAAECLAKRIIDMPKKLEASGTINGQGFNLIIQPREEPEIIDVDYEE